MYTWPLNQQRKIILDTWDMKTILMIRCYLKAIHFGLDSDNLHGKMILNSTKDLVLCTNPYFIFIKLPTELLFWNFLPCSNFFFHWCFVTSWFHMALFQSTFYIQILKKGNDKFDGCTLSFKMGVGNHLKKVVKLFDSDTPNYKYYFDRLWRIWL